MSDNLISVITPSFLGEFPGASPHRKEKFIRAVDSFLKQTYHKKELIVISDGCPTTIDVCERRYRKELSTGLIILVQLPRHEPFTGAVRQQGIDIAKGAILCNLDTDDLFLPHHLQNISVTFNPEQYDWAYFNFYRSLDSLRNVEELIDAEPNTDQLCTANVVWRPGLDVSWNKCDGRQDNKAFNAQLIEKYTKRIKIYGCGYVVKHAQFKKVDP